MGIHYIHGYPLDLGTYPAYPLDPWVSIGSGGVSSIHAHGSMDTRGMLDTIGLGIRCSVVSGH